MTFKRFNRDLLEFLRSSPTPFHAVRSIAGILTSNGFRELRENDKWHLSASCRYFVIRNGSSLIAFTGSGKTAPTKGFRMVGAHTDSPCLKLKPSPAQAELGYNQLGIEVYGGVLQAPWFDRDLAIAGRLSGRRSGKLCHRLVDSGKPWAIIPSLAIHLDREVNKNRSINPQTQLPPILGQTDGSGFTELIDRLNTAGEQHLDDILDFELSLYDSQPPAIVGMNGEYICGARLDNLLSCFIGVRALITDTTAANAVLVCTDHEEVGSQSASGADGPFLGDTLRRLCDGTEQMSRAVARSLLVSADNAHAAHPNFSDKHDCNHVPVINGGPVLKVNANQRYASNSITQARFRDLCQRSSVALQNFAVRADMACGSTIGPITAAALGVATVDVGVPQFAMHSVRETAGSKDSYELCSVITRFYADTSAL